MMQKQQITTTATAAVICQMSNEEIAGKASEKQPLFCKQITF